MVHIIVILLTVLFSSSGVALAAEEHETVVDLTVHPLAIVSLAIFVLSYVAVLFEEKTHLPKSKPVMLGAGLIWVTIGFMAKDYGIDHDTLRNAVFHGLDEYASLLLFLLAAMTYISALEDRKVFATLRSKLVQAGFNIKQLFWITGILAFCLSPIADNLTTALVMGAVVMAVGGNDPRFVSLSCINIINAANAGGAFSPFGDITTLMVWQAEKAEFFDFFALFLPSLVSFLIPAVILGFFVPKGMPWSMKQSEEIKPGGKMIIFLGFATIAMAVSFEQFLGLPPFLGMMMGLSILMFWSYYIRKFGKKRDESFDILKTVALSEWDTLLFFFGVIFSVGGLAFIGYLEFASTSLYGNWGATTTNIFLGFVSAIIDNIPVMFAVLSMNPEMDHFQWLLITLTTGIGGSMLSIGSAAGVALMGVARGQYTFFSHLKWTPVIFLGYAAAISVHFLVNG
ncbi:MAG: sodium:proton antiporter [Alphaproteobacteria bacterium CG_4_9_14_3_um_filter_47_13]|nr:MAG: sodium:proton antiporter [Alphaproteobacteria bacterium CG_4_9_14_3_um_filter_47_13]